MVAVLLKLTQCPRFAFHFFKFCSPDAELIKLLLAYLNLRYSVFHLGLVFSFVFISKIVTFGICFVTKTSYCKVCLIYVWMYLKLKSGEQFQTQIQSGKPRYQIDQDRSGRDFE